MHMSTKPRLASLYVQHLPHVKKQALAQRSYTESRLASLYVQHLPHVKNKPSPKDHTSTCEETSSCPKITSTLPHVKKQALYQRSYAHVYRTQTSLSLRATSSTSEGTSSCPKITSTLRSSTHEETSPRPKIIRTLPHVSPKIICTCLQNPD